MTTSVEIKKQLRQAFKGIKFSCRRDEVSCSERFNVSWTGGPNEDEVMAVIGHHHTLKDKSDMMSDYFHMTGTEIALNREFSLDEIAFFTKGFAHQLKEGQTLEIGYMNNYFIIKENGRPDWDCHEQRQLMAYCKEYNKTGAISESWEAPAPVVEVEVEVTPEPSPAVTHDVTEGMKEVSPYFVTAKFARLNKNATIAEYIEQVEADNYYTEEVQVCYELKVNHKDWNVLMINLLTDFSGFKGKGGHDSHYTPNLSGQDFWRLNAYEREEYNKQAYRCNCILVTNGWNQVVIDPQGYSYARYVGLDVQAKLRLVA